MLQLVDKEGRQENAEKVREIFRAYTSRTITQLAIFGPQAGGKSTLLNALFGFDFPTLADDGARKRTTDGIWLGVREYQDRVVAAFDCEGTDSAQRLLNSEVSIESKIGVFACAVSDVMIINLWQSDLGRYAASNYHIVQQIFQSYFSQLKAQRGSGEPIRLIFVVRDAVISSPQQQADLEASLKADVGVLYSAFSETEPLERFFKVRVAFLAHRKYEFEKFQAGVAELRELILEETRCVKMAGEMVPDVLKRFWEVIAREEYLDLQQQREVIARQKMELFAQELDRRFEGELQTVETQLQTQLEQKETLSCSGMGSVSMNLRAIQQTYQLTRLASYLAREKPFELLAEKRQTLLQQFTKKCTELGVLGRDQLAAEFRDKLDQALGDFGMNAAGIFSRACQASFDAFQRDYVEHFRQYGLSEQPFRFPIEIFTPISPCQVFMQQTTHQVNALLSVVEGPIAAILKAQQQIVEPTPSECDGEAQEETIQLEVIRSTFSRLSCAPAFMRVSAISLNQTAATEAFGIVSEALVTGLYWLYSKILGQDVLEPGFSPRSRLQKLVTSSLFELIQHENVESEFLFRSVQDALLNNTISSLKLKLLNYLDLDLQKNLCNRPMEALSKQRDTLITEATKQYLELLQSYLQNEFFEGELNQQVLFSSRNGGDSLENHLGGYERFNQQVAIKTPSAKRGAACSFARFKYLTTQQYDIQALALFDQEYSRAVSAFVEKMEGQEILKTLLDAYKSRMAAQLAEQRGGKYASEKTRAQNSAKIEQEISRTFEHFGGPLVSRVGLESMTIPSIRGGKEIASQFHESVLREIAGYPVYESNIHWGMLLFMAFLARRDIAVALKNKIILTIILVFLALAAYAHQRRGLSGLAFETEKLYDAAVVSVKERDWQQINKALAAWWHGVRKWWE